MGGQGGTLLWAVCCQILQVPVDKERALIVRLACVAEAELGAACWSLAGSKLIVEDVLIAIPVTIICAAWQPQYLIEQAFVDAQVQLMTSRRS